MQQSPHYAALEAYTTLLPCPCWSHCSQPAPCIPQPATTRRRAGATGQATVSRLYFSGLSPSLARISLAATISGSARSTPFLPPAAPLYSSRTGLLRSLSRSGVRSRSRRRRSGDSGERPRRRSLSLSRSLSLQQTSSMAIRRVGDTKHGCRWFDRSNQQTTIPGRCASQARLLSHDSRPCPPPHLSLSLSS